MTDFSSNSLSTTIVGDENDAIGQTLALADFNGDGIEDYILSVEAHEESPGGIIVVFCSSEPLADVISIIDLQADEYVQLTVAADGADTSGVQIVTGDFNGDGIADVALSGGDAGAPPSAGSVYLFLGQSESDPGDEARELNLTADLTITGATAGDGFGTVLTGWGDLDGDGSDELVVSTGRSDSDNTLFILYSEALDRIGTFSIDTIPTEDMAMISGIEGVPTFVDGIGQDVFAPDSNSVPDFAITTKASDAGDSQFLIFDGLLAQDGVSNAVVDLVGGQYVRIANPFVVDTEPVSHFSLAATLVFREPEVLYSNNAGYLGRIEFSLIQENAETEDANVLDLALLEDSNQAGWGVTYLPDLSRPQNASGLLLGADNSSDQIGATFTSETGDVFGDQYAYYDLVYGYVHRLLKEDGLDEALDAYAFLLTDQTNGSDAINYESSILTWVDADISLLAQIYSADSVAGNSGWVGIERSYLPFFDEEETTELVSLFQSFAIVGETSMGGFAAGFALGDVNGDGTDDMVISAPHTSTADLQDTGKIYTVVGGKKLLGVQDAADGTRDTLIQVEFLPEATEIHAGLVISADSPDDQFGISVKGIGDINGDGLVDFAIAEMKEEEGQESRIFIFYGDYNFQTATLDIADLTVDHGFVVRGPGPGGTFGYQVSPAGDVNHDEIADFLILADSGDMVGSTGTAYLIYGSDAGFPPFIDLGELTSEQGVAFGGLGPLDMSGAGMTPLGDFNGDGVDDFAVSSVASTTENGDNTGVVYVVYGNTGGFPDTVDLTTLSSATGFRIIGASENDLIGRSLSFAKDLNGDGIGDLLIGAPSAQDDQGQETGGTYVIFGSGSNLAQVNLAALDPAQGVFLAGETELGGTGQQVDGKGDFNGDGKSDLLVNAPEATTEGTAGKGQTYLLFGSDEPLPGSIGPQGLAGANGTTFLFDQVSSEISSVHFVGDLNDDGFDDVLFAIAEDPATRDEGRYLGEYFLVFGRSSALDAQFDLASLDGTDGFRITGAAYDEDFGIVASALGDVDSDGHDDIGFSRQTVADGAVGTTPDTFVIFGGGSNLEALDWADGADDGVIDIANLSINYVESGIALPGNDVFEGTVTDDAAALGSLDVNGDLITTGDDVIKGFQGDDFLAGSGGDDLIDGGQQNDVLLGEAGADTLLGQSGDDTLLGGEGADVLNGGPGTDILTGGEGADVFDLAPGDGINTIKDFELGVDRLDLTALERTVALDALANAQLGSAILTFADGTQITIEGDGVTPQSLLQSGSVILALENAAADGAPVILGIAEEDQTLSLDLSNITDADGYDPEDITVEWFRDAETTAVGTGLTYVLGQADVGAQMRAEASFQDDDFNAERVISDPTAAVANVNDRPLGVFSHPSLTFVGTETTVDFSNVSDADGIDEQTITYSWRRVDLDGNDLGLIAGADGPTYTPVAADAGLRLEVTFSYIDLFGMAEQRVASGPFVDRPASGSLGLAGLAEVGETLSADLTGIVEPDGVDEATITYQWQRDGIDIAGANGADYLLTSDDLGAEISLQLVYEDMGGKEEEFISSVILPVNPDNAHPVGLPIIIGTAEEDQTLTVDLSDLTDADGYDPDGVAYQWQRSGVDVADAAGESYTLTQEDVGEEITVVVSYTDGSGTDESVTSDPTPEVENVLDDPEGFTTVTGLAQVGEVVTVDISGVTDEDGIDLATLSYTWRYETGARIQRATNDPSLVLQEEDIGRQVYVVIEYRDFFGNDKLRSGYLSEEIVEGERPATGDLILGTALQGVELTTDLSVIDDPEGVDLTTVSYAWFRDDVAVTGQTGDSYLLSQDDVGTIVSVEISFDDLSGNPETVTEAIDAPVENINDPLTGSIQYSPNSFEVGTTVQATPFLLTDPDGFDPSAITWQWERLFPNGGGRQFIEGATSDSYTITEEDLGSYPFANILLIDDFGRLESISWLGGFVNQLATGPVTITGTVKVGETVSADVSAVQDLDGYDPADITFQWLRDGQEIMDATDSDYAIGPMDRDSDLSVQASFADDVGQQETLTSAAAPVLQADGISRTGTPGDDPDLLGGLGDDTVIGLASNDRLEGGFGDDILDGGSGRDTAVFDGPQGAFTLALSPDRITITDRREGGLGTDELISIEVLDFAPEIPLFDSGPMPLDIFDSPVNLTAEEFSSIAELYIAYFNRAPDAIGLYYWASELEQGSTVLNTAISLFPQLETQATYRDFLSDDGTTLTNTGAFVEAVYTNVLGRGPDTPGFNYWVDELENNENITPANFILALINGAKFGQDTPESLADRIYLSNKVDIGLYYSAIKGLSGVETSRDVMALYTGPDSTTAVVAEIDSIYADALDPDTGEFLMQLVGVIDDPFAVG